MNTKFGGSEFIWLSIRGQTNKHFSIINIAILQRGLEGDLQLSPNSSSGCSQCSPDCGYNIRLLLNKMTPCLDVAKIDSDFITNVLN